MGTWVPRSMSISALSGECSITARRSELPAVLYVGIYSRLAGVGRGRARPAERIGIAHRRAACAVARAAALLKWPVSGLRKKKPPCGCAGCRRALTLCQQSTVTLDCALVTESVLSQEAGARATESGATRLEIHRAGLGWAKRHGRCELQAPDCSVPE